jgi:hypothetical protein
MAEPDASQIFAKALPLIAVVFMASGIVVKSIPLESRRPVDPERVKLTHAGRQDIEARLWEDPFTAMRHVKGRSPEERCKESLEDRAHHPDALRKSIAYRAYAGHAVSVLPVMVPGGPYFEDGEARRRSRYAVVFALLQSGWTPASEDKLGYIWTLESCAEAPWDRLAPELLPYEWFRFNGTGEGTAGETRAARRHLLVLWVDEDAVGRRPLHGIERIVERLAVEIVPCAPVSGAAGPSKAGDAQSTRPGKLCIKPGEPLEAKGCGWPNNVNPGDMKFESDPVRKRPPPWCETRVIGPVTSGTLHRIVHELAQSSKSATTARWLRFYSSGATAALDKSSFENAIDDVRLARTGRADKVEKPKTAAALQELFRERVVRLTATDDRLTKAFETELGLRLVDPTPFWRVDRPSLDQNPLCASTVVLVSEGDSSYARDFQKDFQRRFTGDPLSKCSEHRKPSVVPVRYLRGLDGVLPEGAGAPVPAAGGQYARAPDARDTLLDPIALERADGRSQYDYLRRLAQQLADLGREEKGEGRNGIRAIGVLGYDAYDKLLVVDALRAPFPDAVFFAADLDARLIGGAGVRSTRNLVVASAYGLSLHPGIQREAPPFRDTYQTGTYLATLVALDPEAKGLRAEAFERWFEKPQLFEIGRTRAVPLSKGAVGECATPNPMSCANVHALDEWRGAWPSTSAVFAFAAMGASAAGLLLLLSQRARKMASSVRQAASPGRVAVAALFLLVLLFTLGLAGKIIWDDASSGQGEPFAWFEGVSTWPTQILRLGIFMLTIALLDFGRWQLRRSIDEVAEHFGLKTLTAQEAEPFPTIRGWKAKFRWLWCLETKDAGASEGTQAPVETGPWIEYLDHARFGPSTTRIVVTSAIFFAFSLALMSLAWPHSPHRGEVAAWFNHVLLLLLLGGMTALLFAAFDATGMATRLLARLDPSVAMPRRVKPEEEDLRRRYPVGKDAFEAWIHFRLAVRVASAVNWFIYLPFLTLFLIIPTQSRIFDAWDLPLPYAALLAISIVLAVLCARRLRHAATRLKVDILDAIETEAQACELNLPAGQAENGDQPPESGSSTVPRQVKAVLLKRIAEEIRAVRDGPFLPLSQEPAVRAILLLLGGAGGISTVEFLFLSGR